MLFIVLKARSTYLGDLWPSATFLKDILLGSTVLSTT